MGVPTYLGKTTGIFLKTKAFNTVEVPSLRAYELKCF